MTVKAKILNKYSKIKNTAVKTLHISVGDHIELMPGDTIILNPRNLHALEIKRKEILSTVYPYPNG